MRLTFFGLTLSSSWANGHATPFRAIIRALAAMGHDVTFFERDVEYYARHRDFSDCSYCELVLYPEWQAVRTRALAAAAESDVVVTASYLSEGAQINDELLALPRPLHVFYDLDTPITLEALRAGKGETEHLRASQMPDFDLYLSFVGGTILDELRATWQVRAAAPLYGCVDPDTHLRATPATDYLCDLSYMATFSPDRQTQVEELLLAAARRLPEQQFVLAGAMFPEGMAWTPNLRGFAHIPCPQHAAFYSSSRATLNITRAAMARHGYCPSGRFFESAACATPVITDLWDGLATFFTPGEEVFPVLQTEDVIRLLRQEPGMLRRAGLRARQRALDEHTGRNRARQMLAAIESAARAKPDTIQETRRIGPQKVAPRFRKEAA